MKVVTLDFETYYDREYSLSKMTTEEYIRDPRFEALILAAQVDDEMPVVVEGPDISDFLESLDLTDKAVCAHNVVFDGAILAFRYGIYPKAYLDTLSMARPKHAKTTGCSLAALAKHYGLEEKGTEVVTALGKRRADFTDDDWAAYKGYCAKDVRICRALFKTLMQDFPSTELRTIDTTIRMYTDPMIELDTDVLSAHYDDVVANKDRLLSKLAAETYCVDARTALMSNQIFAALLQQLGVEPPTKVSARTGKETWAFAKTDQAFKDLLEHEDPRVVALVEARLGVKTTIEETRTQRLLSAAKRGPLPVMLNYYGAHSSRFSGGEKLNIQNFPRGGALRASLTLPKGWVVMSCDLSQIEARLNAYNAGQEDVLQQFRDKKDIYSEFGTVVYGYPVSKGTPKERQVAKCAVLGLGYGMGKAKFELYSRQQNVHLSTDEAGRIVDVYRRKHKNIVASWTACETVLWNMVCGKSGALNHFVRYDPEKIILPDGITIMYPALQPLPDGSRGYRYIKDPRSYKKWQSGETEGVKWEYVFGAKLVENCCRRGTLVLTSRGWVPIECVKATDLVFDGVEYVSHKGVVHKGVQECIPVCGAWFTPEHRILENGTWVEASFVQRPDRPEIWAFGSRQMGSSGGKPENNMGMEVRLREGGSSETAGSVRDDVFDILDCGPRHRFVCKGSEQPMIAHNCVQALARVVITEQMNEIAKRYKVLFQVHDEIVIAVKDEEVNEAKMFMESVMRTSPYWAPDLPLDCECKYGKSYKDCK